MHEHPLTWPYRLAMSVILAGALTFGAALGYMLWPVRVIYVDQPMQVLPEQVRAGEWLRLKVRYSKSFSAVSMVGFILASKGNVVLLPLALSSLPPGEHEIGVWVRMPPELPPDEYVIQMVVEHPVRLPLPAVFDRPVVAVSEPFTVVQ